MSGKEFGKGSKIAINDTICTVRGGGLGNKSWIAKITGTHPQYGLNREFCKKDRSDLSRSGKSGTVRFEVTEPGIYEYRNFTISSRYTEDGFVRLNADGSYDDLEREEVLEIVR